MVKFSKQLELQLVPEWKSAFCNYSKLKKDLKKIRLQSRPLAEVHNDSKGALDATLLPLSNLTRRRTSFWTHQDVIMVHQRKATNQQQDIYETELLEPLAKDEYEIAFFASLDAELNKVNQFYCSKEQEYVQRAELLTAQLNNLIDMRKIFEESKSKSISRSFLANILGRSPSQEATSGSENDDSSGFSTHRRRAIELDMMKSINMQLAGMVRTINPDEEEQGFEDQYNVSTKADGEFSATTSPMQYHVKFDIPKTTPVLTISGLTHMIWDDVVAQAKKTSRNGREDVNITKRKMQYAKKMLRIAFAEFYRGLGLLRSFRSLNMLAFAKILKKYDKVTGRHASSAYIKVVERAHFNSSDKVVSMMDEVERLFTQHFAKDDHKKAMMLLRPIQQKASHTITFFLGLFSGCSLAFFAAFIILAHLNSLHAQLDGSISERYMVSVYPVFSMLFLIVLHMYMYGWNIYMWRQARINYAFIFEFAPKTELKNREVLLVCTGLTTLLMGSMVGHLTAYFKESLSFNPDIIPMTLLLVFLLLLLCPLNVFYRSSRHFFLCCTKRIFFSPLYKVVMADFFLADQFTSQIAAFRHAEYVSCYYLGSHFRNHDTSACHGQKFQNLAYPIAFLPYWWRLMQCLRRWVDEGDRAHLANGGKYLSAMVAAGSRLSYSYNPTIWWLAIFVFSSSMATMYQLYWDLVVDWGLLKPSSRNPWLRDQLVLKQKSVYFFSIVLNIFLRFAWLQSVTHLQFGNLDRRVTDLFFASLEVIRRGHWNFYRLENEHLNNVGKYRAVKTLPLPFRDMDEVDS